MPHNLQQVEESLKGRLNSNKMLNNGAAEQKLELEWYDNNKSIGRAGKYDIELHYLNELLKEKR